MPFTIRFIHRLISHVDCDRELINLAYYAICQYIGPVKADHLLAMTIQQTAEIAKEHHVNLHTLSLDKTKGESSKQSLIDE